MWAKYHKWKRVCRIVLVILALFLVKTGRPDSFRWYAGAGIVVFLFLAFVAEVIASSGQGRGQPCASCGQKIQMKPFRLLVHCPHCGQVIE